MSNNLQPSLIGEWLNKKAGILLHLQSDGNYTYSQKTATGIDQQRGRWGANQTKLVLIAQDGREVIHSIQQSRTCLTLDGQKFNPVPSPKADPNSVPVRPHGVNQLCGHWTQYQQGNLYGGGFQVQRHLILDPSGRYQFGKESHQNAKFGQADMVHREQGNWELQGASLILEPDQGEPWQMSLDLANNRNGDPCLVLNGQTYVSKHRRPAW